MCINADMCTCTCYISHFDSLTQPYIVHMFIIIKSCALFRARELNGVRRVSFMHQSCSRINNELNYVVNTLMQNTQSSHDCIHSPGKQCNFHSAHTNCMHIHTCSHKTRELILDRACQTAAYGFTILIVELVLSTTKICGMLHGNN